MGGGVQRPEGGSGTARALLSTYADAARAVVKVAPQGAMNHGPEGEAINALARTVYTLYSCVCCPMLSHVQYSISSTSS